METTNKDKLWEHNSSYEELHRRYVNGEIEHLNNAEFSILEFCHNHDMIEFLREEFTKHPIKVDEEGGLITD